MKQSTYAKPSSSSREPHNNFPVQNLLRSELKIQLISDPLAFDVTSDAILDLTFDVTFYVSFDATFEFTFHVVFAVRCQVSGVRCQLSGVRCQVPVSSWPRAI